MSDQIECVGGPRDGTMVSYCGFKYKVRQSERFNLFLPVDSVPDNFRYKAYDIHVYEYDQSKYVYKGVEK